MALWGMISGLLFLISLVHGFVVAGRRRQCDKQVGDREMGGLMFALCYGSRRDARRAASAIMLLSQDAGKIRLLARQLPLIEKMTARYDKADFANPKDEIIVAAVRTIRLCQNNTQCPAPREYPGQWGPEIWLPEWWTGPCSSRIIIAGVSLALLCSTCT